MNGSTQLILIEGSEEIANEIRVEIESLSGAQYQISERRNLDGSEAAWILIASLAIQALPHILDFISSRRTTKIKVGEIEIENPTPDDLARLRQLYAKYAEKKGEDD